MSLDVKMSRCLFENIITFREKIFLYIYIFKYYYIDCALKPKVYLGLYVYAMEWIKSVKGSRDNHKV